MKYETIQRVQWENGKPTSVEQLSDYVTIYVPVWGSVVIQTAVSPILAEMHDKLSDYLREQGVTGLAPYSTVSRHMRTKFTHKSELSDGSTVWIQTVDAKTSNLLP